MLWRGHSPGTPAHSTHDLTVAQTSIRNVDRILKNNAIIQTLFDITISIVACKSLGLISLGLELGNYVQKIYIYGLISFYFCR